MDTVYEIINGLQDIVNNYSLLLGLLISFIIIFIESIIPILPSGIFIALIIVLFGKLLGLSICYIGTILGCITSYFIFKKLLSKWLNKKYKDNEKMNKLIHSISNIELSKLTVLLAFPFTPAFPINIAAGLVQMDFKKFFISCLISKAATVYFWGFVGTSFKNSMTDPTALIKIIILLVITFVVSKIVTKKMNIGL